MDSIRENLQESYPVFSLLEIKDTRFSENENLINLNRNIEYLSSKAICHGLKEYIELMNKKLGKNAGPFFYKEISSRLSQCSNDLMKSHGIDLMIMQLEYEISTLEKRILKTTKKNKNVLKK